MISVGSDPGIIRATTLAAGADISLGVVTQTGVSMLVGKGNGTFQTPINLPTSFEPSSLAYSDFTGEGLTDIALSSDTAPGLSLITQIGVNISGASATGTIMGPTASLSTASGPVSENGGVAVVTATLPAPISVDTVLTLSFGGDLGPNVNYTVSGTTYNAATQGAHHTRRQHVGVDPPDREAGRPLFGPPQDTTTVAIAAATGSAFTPAAVVVTFNEADPLRP